MAGDGVEVQLGVFNSCLQHLLSSRPDYGPNSALLQTGYMVLGFGLQGLLPTTGHGRRYRR